MYYFTHPRGKSITSNKGGGQEEAEFEDVICGYVDALAIAKKIKNVRKRAVIVYKALGYCDFEIALNLGISERTIRRYTSWIKEILKNMS